MCSIRFLRRSRTGWGSGSRSFEQLSKLMAERFGPRAARIPVRSFTSGCRFLISSAADPLLKRVDISTPDRVAPQCEDPSDLPAFSPKGCLSRLDQVTAREKIVTAFE